MICELQDNHMREQSRSGKSALDGTRWRRRFDEPITAGAGELRPSATSILPNTWPGPTTKQALLCGYQSIGSYRDKSKFALQIESFMVPLLSRLGKQV
jgi:hypothetical protein